MEYSKLIAARYSVRAYRPDPVEDEKLKAILDSGAPSTDRSQSATYSVDRDAHSRAGSRDWQDLRQTLVRSGTAGDRCLRDLFPGLGA